MTRLTPIHVRGKRKPKSSVASSISISHETMQDGVASNIAAPVSQRSKRSLNDALAHRKMTRPRSLIESLPLEVIETILLYSRSFALPRASHLIGAKLSGKATLFRLFFAAFHETWDQGFGNTKSLPFIFDHGSGDAPTFKDRRGDPELQTEMLALPWVNIEFIIEAQQIWADRFARDRPYCHWRGKSGFPADEPHDEIHPSPSASLGVPQAQQFNARECFETDYRGAAAWISSGTEWMSHTIRMQEVHPLVRLPNYLITGPWSEEDRRFLFWLTRAGATGHTTAFKHTPWETRVACLRNAFIHNPEPEAFVEACLMLTQNVMDGRQDLWLYHGLPVDVAADMVGEISKRLDWGADGIETRALLRRLKNFLHELI